MDQAPKNIKGRPRRPALFHVVGMLLAAQRFHALVQAGLISGSGVAMQYALLYRFVDDRNGFAVTGFRGFRVSGCEGLAQAAECAAKTRPVGAIDSATPFGLTGALQGGYVVCHNFVVADPSLREASLGNFRGGYKILILRQLEPPGQTLADWRVPLNLGT